MAVIPSIPRPPTIAVTNAPVAVDDTNPSPALTGDIEAAKAVAGAEALSKASQLQALLVSQPMNILNDGGVERKRSLGRESTPTDDMMKRVLYSLIPQMHLLNSILLQTNSHHRQISNNNSNSNISLNKPLTPDIPNTHMLQVPMCRFIILLIMGRQRDRLYPEKNRIRSIHHILILMGAVTMTRVIQMVPNIWCKFTALALHLTALIFTLFRFTSFNYTYPIRRRYTNKSAFQICQIS